MVEAVSRAITYLFQMVNTHRFAENTGVQNAAIEHFTCAFCPWSHSSKFDSCTNPIPPSGIQSLPAPNSTLKFITIARGTQNYTCTSASSTPVLVGANAVLLDASPLLPLLPPGEGTAVLDLLPRYVIDLSFAAIKASSIPKLGIHYFDSKGVPTFDLGNNGLLKAKGLADIPAPANASAGPFDQGNGAVSWKTLIDAGGSVGLKEVYRVETAGGKPPSTCTGVTAPLYIDYSALYWFFD